MQSGFQGVAGLDGARVDTLVIGGGILGAGVAAELARRGLSCLLVEERDFAQGTTAKSTRLIHGGLRYLEVFDFGLVREGLRERTWQLRDMANLVRPLPFLLPHYNQSLWQRSKVRVGLTFYDLLSPRHSLPRHRRLARDEVRRLEPALSDAGLQMADLFWDGQVELPERLVIEVLRQAAELGAQVRNHVAAVGLRRQGRAIAAVELRDVQLGHEATVFVDKVVNASGPWADQTLRRLGVERPPLLRLTQGVHVVYPALAEHAVALQHPRDKRLCFTIPWQGATLVGTTDTDVPDSPENARIRPEDVDYLVQLAERHLSGASEASPLWGSVGVRALLRLPGKPQAVSRRQILVDHRADDVPGLFTLAGGKLTAWRGIARQIANRLAPPNSRSLPEARAGDDDEPSAHWPGGIMPTRLWRLYGRRADELKTWVDADSWWAEPILPGGEALRAEVAHAFACEWAVTLSDVVVRRLALAFGADLGREAALAVAGVCRARLGWSEERVEREMRDLERQNEERRLPCAAPAAPTGGQF